MDGGRPREPQGGLSTPGRGAGGSLLLELLLGLLRRRLALLAPAETFVGSSDLLFNLLSASRRRPSPSSPAHARWGGEGRGGRARYTNIRGAASRLWAEGKGCSAAGWGEGQVVVVGRRLRERYASRNRLNATARTAASSFPSARRSSTAENPSVDRRAGRPKSEPLAAPAPCCATSAMGYVPRSDLTVRAPQQGPGQRSKALGSAQLALQLPFQGLKESTPGKACRAACACDSLSPTGAKKDFSSSFGPGAAQTKAKAKASSLLERAAPDSELKKNSHEQY